MPVKLMKTTKPTAEPVTTETASPAPLVLKAEVPLKKWLAVRAKTNGRSMHKEALWILKAAMLADQVQAA
jgi:hypothetical protein